MALKQLLVAQKLKDLRAKKEELAQAIAATEGKRAAWKERESRAEAALAEMTDETTAEERAAFDAECAEIEAEDKTITAEEEANTTRAAELEEKITALEAEAEEIKTRGQAATRTAAEENKGGQRDMEYPINVMANPTEARRAMFREVLRNDEARGFVEKLTPIFQKRGVTNAVYTVPTILMPMITEATKKYSKLLKHVNRGVVQGEGEQNILMTAPEAVWTEMTGVLNELDIGFYQAKTYGNKLGGFLPIPNPYLEDSAEDMAAIITDQLGQANGLASDKAIIYGNGDNMPVGIIPQLVATTAPSWQQNRMPPFVNVSTTHVGKVSAATVKGVDLYSELAAVLLTARHKYEVPAGNENPGDKFWAMNESTWAKLVLAMMSIDASGAVVTGAQRIMPLVGGAIEFLEFMPNNVIAGGDGTHYIWRDRSVMKIDFSEHVRFIEDQTVARVRSRADGLPVTGEAFAAFSLSTTAVPGTIDFAEDTANADGSDNP